MAGIGHRHRLLVLVASPGASLQRRVGALKMRQDATRVNQKGHGGSGEHRLATQQLCGLLCFYYTLLIVLATVGEQHCSRLQVC